MDIPRKWVLFNGARVCATKVKDVLDFRPRWRSPVLVVFRKVGTLQQRRYSHPPVCPINHGVFNTASMSAMNQFQDPHNPHNPHMPRKSFTELARDELAQLGKGPHCVKVAIDCEFVSTIAEEAVVLSDGRREVKKDSVKSLARVSIVRGWHGVQENSMTGEGGAGAHRPGEGRVGAGLGTAFIDDYIAASEPIVDYLTRFSGLHPGDLDPSVSRHHLVSLKASYLKLRHLVDIGCVFVGHGLTQDFKTCNIAVPPDQVRGAGEMKRDTVGSQWVGCVFV